MQPTTGLPRTWSLGRRRRCNSLKLSSATIRRLGKRLRNSAPTTDDGSIKLQQILIISDEEGGVRCHCEIDVFAVFGIAGKNLVLRHVVDPRRHAKMASEKSINSFRGQGRELCEKFWSGKNVTDLGKRFRSETERHVTLINQIEKGPCETRAGCRSKKEHAVIDGKRTHALLAFLACCSSHTSVRSSSPSWSRSPSDIPLSSTCLRNGARSSSTDGALKAS